MRNLLSNLRELVKRKRALGDVDIELGLQGSAQPGFDGFFEQVSEIEKLLETLAKLLKDLQNLANKGKPGFGEGSDVDRSRTFTTNALTIRLKNRISEFQTLRETIRKEYREVVVRRVYTVTGEHADEETIDRLIETGESEKLFQRAIQEHGHGRVLDTVLQGIQERHDTLKEIETNLLQLHQIFVDLSVLVEAQGEVVDNIEDQVKGASEDVKVGINQLQKAKNLQKNTQNWTCIAIIIIPLIIILVVVLSSKPWAK